MPAHDTACGNAGKIANVTIVFNLSAGSKKRKISCPCAGIKNTTRHRNYTAAEDYIVSNDHGWVDRIDKYEFGEFAGNGVINVFPRPIITNSYNTSLDVKFANNCFNIFLPTEHLVP